MATWGLSGGRVTIRLLEPIAKPIQQQLHEEAARVLRYLGMRVTAPRVVPAALNCRRRSTSSGETEPPTWLYSASLDLPDSEVEALRCTPVAHAQPNTRARTGVRTHRSCAAPGV